ncbi:MAG: hypothetical protein R8G34_15260 [Paracoccaceae bacterium]|nr:hypothetical protein [Paracoccaceae bacterium]
MDLALVADFPDLIPTLGEWYRNSCPEEKESGRDPEDDFRGCANRDTLPIALVALQNGEPVGATFVLGTVSRADPALGPWLDGGFVPSSERHNEICMFMKVGSIALCHKMGFVRVNQGVRSETAAQWYEKKGWVRFDLPGSNDPSAIYLTRSTEALKAPAGRRWCF